MGANTPKSTRDQAYRTLVTAFLKEVMERHDLNKSELANALGVDRASASRYLSGKVRAPLQRLSFLYRTVREHVPRDVEEAFWDSEAQQEATIRKAG